MSYKVVSTSYKSREHEIQSREHELQSRAHEIVSRAHELVSRVHELVSRAHELALRQIIFGNSVHSFSREWKRTYLLFQDISSAYPWGIQTQRCGSRGLILCLQAYLLKHLLFEREYISNILVQSSLKPNEFERRRALIQAMSEILWKVGDKRRCCICLLQEDRCFNQDYRIRDDGITEKVILFEFKKYSDLNTFIRRNIEEFTTDGHPGCVLFLYSIVLSATIYKLREEMLITDESPHKLLTDNEELTKALTNLLLTGHAVHYLHNGNMLYSSHGRLLPQPLKGIKERSDIGYMYWDKGENDDNRTEVGSMLKTPRYPIWISNINGQPGLLFSTNLELVSDWRVENRFILNYYTGLTGHPPCPLHIETRFGRHALGRTRLHKREEEEKIPQLERCIMTKYVTALANLFLQISMLK
ncbi:hypothetical protein FSP39_025402 [Pinctada imbricata]|uniref:Ubiquitin carboxyl-terminal hydrolase MINDY n=1 Tax=Pinctada imbricata TaxID=66713 RepID=A0AA88YGF6_PINIB|nr:hypothetical protein FSP39_025402 [Pinctada imbricata]